MQDAHASVNEPLVQYLTPGEQADNIYNLKYELQFIEHIEILPNFMTGQSTVQVNLDIDNVERGSGYWKICTTLVCDLWQEKCGTVHA